jgi:O-antigen/teichoic acid export membrane protein
VAIAEREVSVVPSLSIVVISRGPSLALARLLRSLGRADQIEHTEILIGLDGGRGRAWTARLAARIAPRCDVQVVELPRGLPGENRNHLVARATAPIVLFLDDDVEIRGDLLRETLAVMADETVVVAGGPNLTPAGSPEFEQLAGRVLASTLATGPVRHRYHARSPGPATERSLTLCNLAIRRVALHDRAFDDALQCAEENELLARLTRAGARMIYSPNLAVFHHRRPTLRSHLAQMIKYGFGRGQLLTRSLARGQATHAVPAVAVVFMIAAAAINPYVFAIPLLSYLVVVAGGASRLGTARQLPVLVALVLATHLGYAWGVLRGSGYEAARLTRQILRAGEGRLGRDAVATFIALQFSVAAGVGAGVVLARALAPDGRGAFELARTLALVLSVPGGLALGRGAVFLLPRGALTAKSAYGAATISLASGSLVALALGAALTIERGWHGLSVAESLLVCASIPMAAFFLQAQNVLQGVGLERWWRRTTAAREAVFLVLLALALLLDVSVVAALTAWALHWLVAGTIVAWLLVRSFGRPQLPHGAWRRLGAFGTSQAFAGLLSTAHRRLDIVVLAAVGSAAAVGHYAVAFGTAEILVYGGMALGATLFPRTAASSADEVAGGAQRTARATRVVFVLTLAGAALLALVGPTLISLVFGSQFAPAGAPLRALLPGIAALAVLLVLQQDLAARGKVRSVAAATAAAVIANLLLNLVLVPRFGASGAAAASSVTYAVTAAILLAIFIRTTRVSLRACLVPRRRDARAVRDSFAGRRGAAPASA